MKYITIFFILVTFNVIESFGQTPKPYNNRILVIGGGGMRGAWGGGFAQHLSDSLGAYKIVYGTSTGSLLAPLIILNKFDSLKEAYTSVNQKDIFNKNPFNKKGNLKWLYCLWRVFSGKKSFGETRKLRDRMDDFLYEGNYRKIRESPDSLMYTVAVTNMASGQVGYACSRNHGDLEDMKDWMWASANEPLFMNYVNIHNDIHRPNIDSPFVDGGVISNVPILEAVDYAKQHNARVSRLGTGNRIDTIDVIINKPKNALVGSSFDKKDRKIFKGLLRLIQLWSVQIRNDNIQIGELQAKSDTVKNKILLEKAMPMADRKMKSVEKRGNYIVVNLYFYPTSMFVDSMEICQKELLFDKKRMQKLWALGYKGVSDATTEQELKKQQLLIPVEDEEIDELIKTNSHTNKQY